MRTEDQNIHVKYNTEKYFDILGAHAKQIDMTFSDMAVIPNCSKKLQAIETQYKGNNNSIAGERTVNITS